MPKAKQNRSAKWRFLQKPKPEEGLVIGQVRYSSDNQDPRTIEAQKAHILAEVEKEGWKLVGWCEEPESSASYDELEYRPEFAKLLTQQAGRECNVVICDETSRWARSSEVGHKSLRLLRERNCWWQTVQDDWDINKPLTDGGAIMWAITQSQNEDYSRKLSYHTHKGKMQKAKDGYSNGVPVYGYRAPTLVFDPSSSVQEFEEMRRHLIYEPDPDYFPGLVKLGELAAQQSPILSYREIAEEMNRLGFRYYSTRGKFIADWNVERVYGVLRRVTPCEFEAGGGKGTIRAPDGTLFEGLHQAAWPFDVWQRIYENKQILKRSPGRYRKTYLGPLQGLLVCKYCGRPMKYRENIGSRTLKRTGENRTYHTFYYVCYEYLRPCTVVHDSERRGVWVREYVAEGQFGKLLELFGTWLDDALRAIREEYAAIDGAKVDATLDYESQKVRFAQRRQKINDMYEMGEITRTEYIERVQRLRREEMALPVPRVSSHGLTERLAAAQQLDSLAAAWYAAAHMPSMRHKVAHTLFAPNGIVYDTQRLCIVGLRPTPDFYDVIKRMLEHVGWREQEPGLLWCDNYTIVPPPNRKLRYHQVVELIRDRNSSVRAQEIADHLGIRVGNVNLLLKVLVNAGVLYCKECRQGSQYWREYVLTGNEVPIKIAAFRPEHSA